VIRLYLIEVKFPWGWTYEDTTGQESINRQEVCREATAKKFKITLNIFEKCNKEF
jgi:hypothetical protein